MTLSDMNKTSQITSEPKSVAFRTILGIFAFTVLALTFSAPAAAVVTAQESQKPTVFIIGDSTVKTPTQGQQGWGDPIVEFFDLTKINVVNRARGGRSSRTFQTEGLWDQVLAELKPGDFVLMQFGHNDGGALNDDSRARGSIRGVGEETEEIDNLLTKKREVVHSFGWYMRKYVTDTKARGATPIVLSLIPRNIWKDGKVVRAVETYGGWAAEVARTQNACFINLNELVSARYETVGQEKVGKEYFFNDHTHTSPAGARVNAELVVSGLRELKSCSLSAFLLKETSLPSPDTIVLWADGAPDAVGKEPADIPRLTPYLPKGKATGAAVIVCPGGGYQHLAAHEGGPVAEWLNSLGITAFVLKYRLGPRYHHPVQLRDAARAIRLVRARSSDWRIDPQRIGILGFSAGGHLASTAGTHLDSGNPDAQDPVDRVSSRPDFLVLAYPVISFDPAIAHRGSVRNLLGDNPAQALLDDLSNDLRVTADTPPTFLFHTDADTGVVPEHSIRFYLALRRARVPAEIHVFEKGPHGVGLALDDPSLGLWPTLLTNWLRGRGLLQE